MSKKLKEKPYGLVEEYSFGMPSLLFTATTRGKGEWQLVYTHEKLKKQNVIPEFLTHLCVFKHRNWG